MSRSNRRFESWDDGPPGTEMEPDRVSDPQISQGKQSRKDERSGRVKQGASRHSPESHSKRDNYKNDPRGRSYNSDSKHGRKNRRRSRSVSSSTDSQRSSSRYDQLKARRSHKSSSSDRKSATVEKNLKPKRRNASSSSAKSSSSSSTSSKSRSSDSSNDSTESRSSSDSRSRSASRNHRPSRYESRPKQTRSDPSTEIRKEKAPVPFKNDGSFLEMFKKMQESKSTPESEPSTASVVDTTQPCKKPVLPLIMKRRGGRLLKTGLVKKAKAIDEQHVENTPKDAWSLYMQEVKKYRDTTCEEEGKTRPLVK